MNTVVPRRYLIERMLDVCFVQNFTDIDDQILKRASKKNLSMTAVSELNIDSYHPDMDSLNSLLFGRIPRAHCLDEICELTGELEAKDAAYSADRDVHFVGMKHAGRGKLSGRDLNEQQEHAGIGNN